MIPAHRDVVSEVEPSGAEVSEAKPRSGAEGSESRSFSASSRGLPTLFHYLFVAKKVAKSAGLVLAAGRSSARFTKPLKTHSSALLTVASSSSNTTRFATADRGRRSARSERQRPLRRPGMKNMPARRMLLWCEFL